MNIKDCSKCRNGKLIERNGKWGNFLGCSNYPKCKHTEKIRYVKTEVKSVSRNWDNFKPSTYQLAIKEFFTNSNKGNAIVNATAGSGKSTTIEYIASHLTGSILVLAFNKGIATELQSRMPNATVKTLHSFGLNLIKNSSGNSRPKIDNSKVFNYLLNTQLDKNATKEDKKYFYSIAPHATKLVELVQSFGLKDPTNDDLIELAITADLDIKDDILPIVLNWATDALRYTRNDFSVLSFGDMIDLPFYYSYKGQPYDYILVDESQDLNLAQMEIIFNNSTINTRLLFVGDKNQAIYAWRGSASDSMEQIQQLFDCSVFTLPVTYRQSKSAVNYINKILPYIQHIAHDNAIEGNEPVRIDYNEFYKLVKINDMVITRTNAAMIKPVWSLIKSGIKATILGKEIGQDLVKLILKFQRDNIEDTIIDLESHKIDKVNKLNAYGKYSNAQMVADKIDTAVAMLTEFDNIDTTINFIQKVFSNDNEGIVFMTIHKAKGLETKENQNLFILESDLLPIADNNDHGDQELNISFVAFSRNGGDSYLVNEVV